MKPQSIQIVPAQLGFFVVYDDEELKEVVIGDAVIAWRVETFFSDKGDDIFSSCSPLTIDGDVASNCIGVQNPDMTITVFQHSTYSSLAELQQERYPKK